MSDHPDDPFGVFGARGSDGSSHLHDAGLRISYRSFSVRQLRVRYQQLMAYCYAEAQEARRLRAQLAAQENHRRVTFIGLLEPLANEFASKLEDGGRADDYDRSTLLDRIRSVESALAYAHSLCQRLQDGLDSFVAPDAAAAYVQTLRERTRAMLTGAELAAVLGAATAARLMDDECWNSEGPRCDEPPRAGCGGGR